eukprot:scaffold19272_cov129-Isochrysis_galbana.AAC.3
MAPNKLSRGAQLQLRATAPTACRIRGAAKYSPITVTDVQSDGRPRAVPRGSHGALPLRDAVAAGGCGGRGSWCERACSHQRVSCHCARPGHQPQRRGR